MAQLKKVTVGKKEIDIAISQPAKAARRLGFLLGHGASGDLNSGNLPVIAEAISKEGYLCCRYSCSGPLASRVKVLEGLLSSSVPDLSSVKTWVLSGHSMGGRTACAVAVKAGVHKVAGVVLFSYPLHPPNKTGELRDKDLTELQVPVLFVRGTKDPFSEPGPFTAVLPRMKSPDVQVHTVDGGNHALKSKSKVAGASMEEILKAVTAFLEDKASVAEAQSPADQVAASDGKGLKSRTTEVKKGKGSGEQEKTAGKKKAQASERAQGNKRRKKA